MCVLANTTSPLWSSLEGFLEESVLNLRVGASRLPLVPAITGLWTGMHLSPVCPAMPSPGPWRAGGKGAQLWGQSVGAGFRSCWLMWVDSGEAGSSRYGSDAMQLGPF